MVLFAPEGESSVIAEKQLQDLILDISEGYKPVLSLKGNYDDPFVALALAERHAATDSDIVKAERIESIIKLVINDLLSKPVSGETGRQLAAFQQRLGFLFKYKSYTIKCSTLLGYSIFLHNAAEGFSFQRHITHKTEAFHILEVKEGGYVFICEYEDWQRIYDKTSFDAGLSGEHNETYDQFKYEPQPGDFIVVDKLGTVHTVVGCVLEEYATISTDMVDRLHDQNEGRQIPSYFERQYALEQLRTVSVPNRTRHVALENGSNDAKGVEIEPRKIRGGLRTALLDSFLTASLYQVEPRSQTEFFRSDSQASVMFVSAGSGHLLVGDSFEIASMSAPTIPISRGGTVLVAPGLNYCFSNEGAEPLKISEQRIHPEVSLL